MDWIGLLGGLSPIVAIALLYGWTERSRNKARNDEERARVEMIKVLADQFVQPITKGLDANTDAVRDSVRHNETIITNHLSRDSERDAANAQRDMALLSEMQNVAQAIERMNNRKRRGDT